MRQTARWWNGQCFEIDVIKTAKVIGPEQAYPILQDLGNGILLVATDYRIAGCEPRRQRNSNYTRFRKLVSDLDWAEPNDMGFGRPTNEHVKAVLNRETKPGERTYIRKFSNADLENHESGLTTLFVAGNPKGPETFALLDVDCHAAGSAEGARRFSEDLRQPQFFGPKLYFEPSTHGKGSHVYLILINAGMSVKAQKQLLINLGNAVDRYRAAFHYDVEMVEAKLLPHTVERRGGIVVYKAGVLGKAPRHIEKALNTVRLTPEEALEIAERMNQLAEEQEKREKQEGSITISSLFVATSHGDEPKPTNNEKKGEKKEREEGSITISSLSHGKGFKNRFWRTLTGFYQGKVDLPLNIAVVQAARICFAGGLPEDQTTQLITDWCFAIPDPKSTRLKLEPAKADKDARRIIHNVYEGNGRQADAEGSLTKLRASIEAWRRKGLVFWDRATWDTTCGYAAVADINFTEQERKNIEIYLGPLLSSRETKERGCAAVAVAVAGAVIKLVRAKSGKPVSIPYLQKYLAGECQINTGKRDKVVAIMRALAELRFAKVVHKGTENSGATRYGLAGRMAKVLGVGEEWTPPKDLDMLICDTITSVDCQIVPDPHNDDCEGPTLNAFIGPSTPSTAAS